MALAVYPCAGIAGWEASMSMLKSVGVRLFAIELLFVLAVACGNDSSEEEPDAQLAGGADAAGDVDSSPEDTPSPCEGVACSEHGTCVVVDQLATCECDEGYEAVALECSASAPNYPPAVDGDFATAGTFETTMLPNTGPGGLFTVYRPALLGEDGLTHPIITWGNGTGAVPAFYAALLTHLASHGFVVVASNSSSTGSGEAMLEGVAWIIAENVRDGSDYFGMLATDRVGASGHSQGGGGTVAAGADPSVTCTAPIAPWMGATPASVEDLQGPMFTIAGSFDALVPAATVESQVYGLALVPSVYGILIGANHFTPLGDAGAMRGPLTAWFRLNLMADESAREVFVGADCTLCVDPSWEIQSKDL
jgi:pimeloyl-ACP methyl ester carboxylesterase